MLTTVIRIAAVAVLVTWIPLTAFLNFLILSEIKPEERRGGRFWARLPWLIPRRALTPWGAALLTFMRWHLAAAPVALFVGLMLSPA